MLYVEKYRPKEFKDVIGIDPTIEGLMNNLPNLLFIGKPGTGKTTTAKIIISKLKADALVLNASDERGINVIREKVKSFAMTQSSDGKVKIVHMDEFDFMTGEAQNSLRNLIETYHSNVRFICTANYENKIIDALKSRLMTFRFEPANSDEIFIYLKKICLAENMALESDLTIKRLIEVNKMDIRKCINTIQRWSELKRPITLKDVKEDNILPEQIHSFLKSGEFIRARQMLLDSNIEYDVFLEDYHDYVVDLCINKKTLPAKQFAGIIENLTSAITYINQVISKEIIVENFLLRTIRVMKE